MSSNRKAVTEGLVIVVILILPLLSLSGVSATSRVSQSTSSPLSTKNVVLFYDDWPIRKNVYSWQVDYQITRDIAMPLVAHVDSAGNPTDWMFDSIIFYNLWLYFQYNPTQQNITDWVNYLFSGSQVANLDATVAEAKAALAQPNYQMNVFLMLPVAYDSVAAPAIESNANLVLTQWNALSPQNLRLAGFYWGFTENIGSAPGLLNIVPSVSSYLHTLGLKLLMIPYRSVSNHVEQLHTYGFDYVTNQVDFHLDPTSNLTDFKIINDRINAGYVDGNSFEIPFNGNPINCCGGDWRVNLQTYFQQANMYNWNRNLIATYYHGVPISQMGRSLSPDYRTAYDTIYQHIVSSRTPQNTSPPIGSTNTTTSTTTSQTTPQFQPRPLSSLDPELLNAPAGSAYLIFPDYSAPFHSSVAKCGSVNAAQLSDYSAGGYIVGLLANPQNQFLDTSATISKTDCGNPVGIGGTMITIAGPGVNSVVHYYEQVAGITPVYYLWDGSKNNFVVRATGQRYTVSTGNTIAGDDMFLLESFVDQSNRTVFVVYGFSWQGTLAAANFVNTYVRSHLSQFSNSWYIYEWKDAPSGPSANSFPDQGDQYTQVATG